jgi:SPP1 family predicted phage head-tail adaptor
MRAGSLNKRATFQRFASTPDGAGGSTKTWSDFATVWAQFIPENVKEKIQQGRIADQTAGRIVVRYSSTTVQIDGTFRVVLDGVTMNVKSAGVDTNQKKAQLVFPVETDGTAG